MRVIKSRSRRCVGHVKFIARMGSAYKILVEVLEEKKLRNLDLDRMIILN
jgi:hypothetical protein